MKQLIIILSTVFIIFGVFLLYKKSNQFPVPKGETIPFEESLIRANDKNEIQNGNIIEDDLSTQETMNKEEKSNTISSNRKVLLTNGTKHSIPLKEILDGGPGKDGIPSIDDPKFIDTASANKFLNDDEIGIGISIKGESRFYPNQIMVWHEIANDTMQGKPILVTYCPLCATGIVFEREIDGEAVEFGVSGKLWQSNLLMYNRSSKESLWSQVLGEAVLGDYTGQRLAIVPSDVVKYGEWKKAHPDTTVLSRETGSLRNYGLDPYGDYYTNTDVSFGAEFTDNRLHPKDFVLGVEYEGQFKAYLERAIPVGETKDQFAGKEVTINKTENREVNIEINGEPLPFISGFWFSWVAVHQGTEIYK